MVLLVLSIAWVLTVAGLLARAITQYRHYEVIGPGEGGGDVSLAVTVIVPARNEAKNIGRCVNALLEQDYPREMLQVIVMDDGSEDDTAEIVRELAESDRRVELRQAPSLPSGWLGKPHACSEAARHAMGDWLCFLDADTTAEPPLIRTAVHVACERQLELLSLQPVQELLTPWERLILPTGFFLIAFTQDLRRTNDPGSPDASVNGQFLFARRRTYEAVGGHGAVRDKVAEDSALAANFKAAGHRVTVLGTRCLLHTRMYADFRSLWEGAARQAAQLLGSATALVAVALGAIVLGWAALALPAWATLEVASHPIALSLVALVLSLGGTLALFGTHIGAARYFKIPFGYGLLFPIGYTLGAAVLFFALWQRTRRRVAWKGRVYADGPVEEERPVVIDRAEQSPTVPDGARAGR